MMIGIPGYYKTNDGSACCIVDMSDDDAIGWVGSRPMIWSRKDGKARYMNDDLDVKGAVGNVG